MGYPDTAEGFVVTSHKDWNKFTKQEVRVFCISCRQSR